MIQSINVVFDVEKYSMLMCLKGRTCYMHLNVCVCLIYCVYSFAQFFSRTSCFRRLCRSPRQGHYQAQVHPICIRNTILSQRYEIECLVGFFSLKTLNFLSQTGNLILCCTLKPHHQHLNHRSPTMMRCLLVLNL